MDLDPEIESRLIAFGKIFDQISELEKIATNPSVQWELSATATRMQNSIAFLKQNRNGLGSSNVLDLTDKDIKRARGDVAYITKLLDEGGPDAKFPR